MNAPETLPTPPVQKPPTTSPPEAALSPQQETSRVSRSLIVFLLLVLPPVAWIFMWTDKSYHHWFGKLLIVSGILALVITLFSFATIGTQVNQLYASLGVKSTNASLITLTNYVGAGFALLQVAFGIYLQRTMKKQDSLNRVELLITLLLLASSLYVALIPSILVFQDIFPALYKLYQGPSY